MTLTSRRQLVSQQALVALLLTLILVGARFSSAETQSLTGQWGFRLDPQNAGIEQKWFEQHLLDTIRLPGSTDEARKGALNTTTPTLDRPYRLHPYAGPAWYQREIEIPKSWQGQRVTLELERCHWQTRVWVDEREVEMQDSLSVPHVHELGTHLTPGRHRLTLRVDNTLRYEMGKWAHSTSEQTQTNWNGVVGRIALRSSAPVFITGIQVYPGAARKTARVSVHVGNATGKPIASMLTLQARCKDHVTSALSVELHTSDAESTAEAELALDGQMKVWNEFTPNLYELSVKLTSGKFTDQATETFGIRELGIGPDKQLTLDGQPISLRGTLECCIFPKTGYPPTEVESWVRILKICQSYGLNHMRFHSWCPPEAAFVAADRLGVFLQVEAPCWIHDWGKDTVRDKWVEEEVLRILDAYGNHPSFAFMSMGNEPAGDLNVIHHLVDVAKRHDSRRFYMSGTGWGQGPTDDYVVVTNRQRTEGTEYDFRTTDAKQDKPVVSHEVGQWTIYPNLKEMRKYDGVLRALNFQIVADDLKARGMRDQAADFTRASGLQMVQLYKADIEGMLRTPGHSGFQLLDLHDFPGQGTALIGILDPFWDTKSLITPEAWRRFCGPVVPLIRMPKRVYSADETFEAPAELSQFGAAELKAAKPVWTITDSKGRTVAEGSLETQDLPTGRLLPLGKIKASLAKAPTPGKLKVALALKGTDIKNDWDIWVYPPRKELSVPANVVVTTGWDEQTTKALAEGKRVLMLTKGSMSNSLPGAFLPVFWSPVWFKGLPGTMSILCDPGHPALMQFPTQAQSDWEWYDLLNKSRALILDDLPKGFRPLVQVIDNFSRNRRLGNLLEARVGKGKLMICSIDLASDLDQRPAARQLLRSLYDYVSSDSFAPNQSLDTTVLDKVMTGPFSRFANVAAVTADSQQPGNEAMLALDGDPNTMWHTSWSAATEKGFPHELVIEFLKPVQARGLAALPRQDGNQNGWIKDYAVYVSADGKDWGQPVAKGTFAREGEFKRVDFGRVVEARFLKLVALSNYTEKNNHASLAEIEIMK